MTALAGMRFADLFCGIGGFVYGARAAGLGECVWACDTNERARRNYRLNHGNHEPARDIRDADPRDISPFEVLFAGFPCQPFSVSGARRGRERTGLNDPRGTLFHEIVRLAVAKRPVAMVLENVPRLMTMDGGRIWRVVSDALTGAGYDLYPSVLMASRFGIPQARRRLYLVCLRSDSDLTYTEPTPTDEPCCLADLMEAEEDILPGVLDKIIVRHPRLQIREGVDETRRNELIRIGEIPRVGCDRRANQSGRVFSRRGHSPTVTAHCVEKGERSVGGMYLVAEDSADAGQMYRVYSRHGIAPTQTVGDTPNSGMFRVVPRNTPREKVGSGQAVFSLEGVAPTQIESDGGGQGGMFRVVPRATRPGKVGHGMAVHSAEGHAPTQVVATRDQRTQGGMYRRGGYVRVLTAREVARVMGFPDEWIWGSLTQRQAKSLLGNAVIPHMVRLVLDGIRYRSDVADTGDLVAA